ncbi:MAG: DUF4412 domain-containing protein [Gemmatimonadota bacterium]|nr:DUF4412 domain-containing protein [Gemmatimonadota bacterium]
MAAANQCFIRVRVLYVVSLSLALSAYSTVAAQGIGGFGRRVTDAVERKANQKIEGKLDQAAQKLVDHSFDSIFGADNGSSSDGKSGGRLFSMLPNAPTEDHYDFDAVFTYEVENISKGKTSGDKALISMNFNSEGKYTGTRIAPVNPKKGDGDVFAIFDVKNESMVMLMTSDKDKMSMAYSWKDAKRYSTTAPPPTTTDVKTTGEVVTATNGKPMTFSSLGKRTIAGYSADGYKAENEDGNMEVWVTRDPSLTYARMMGASSSMKQMHGVMPGSYPNGMLLEVLSTDRKTGDQGHMIIKSIDTKARVRIDMSEYPRLGTTK